MAETIAEAGFPRIVENARRVVTEIIPTYGIKLKDSLARKNVLMSAITFATTAAILGASHLEGQATGDFSGALKRNSAYLALPGAGLAFLTWYLFHLNEAPPRQQELQPPLPGFDIGPN